MNDNIDYQAVIILIESNWWQFVTLCGGQEDAESTLDALKAEAGIK
jgi:hypothetical protein